MLSSADNSINSRVLFWYCEDDTNLVAAVIRQSLDAWQTSSQTHHGRVILDQPSDANQLGLSVWSLDKQSQLNAICIAIENQKRQHPHIFQLVYLDNALNEHRGLLVEAGANFVVNQINQLQTVLMKVADRLQVSHEGHHPLTSGLFSRLPWK